MALRLAQDYLDRHGLSGDLYIVYQVYVLGSMKWIISNIKNHLLFEITHDREKDLYYVDTYNKTTNSVWKPCKIHGHDTCYRKEENIYD